MKKILFVLNKPPYSGAYSQEILDVAMTAAAFDQSVALLLTDDGVFNLKQGQLPGSAGLKNTSNLFKALPLYDIDTLYVESESLLERGLSRDDLADPVTVISRAQIAEISGQFDIILS